MAPFHIFLAILVTIVWGINFIFVALGLQEIPPLSLCAVRFFLSSVPIIFFIKRPKVPFALIVEYGLIMFALQFSLLFIGIKAGMTSGMASLIMQAQVFFSMFFSVIFLREIPGFWQVFGAIIAFLGICLVGLHVDASISLAGFLCIVAAAAAWGYGNLISKKMLQVDRFSLVIWSSFIACLPMFILAMIVEGPQLFITSYSKITSVGLSALAYIAYVSTWVGYGLWNWLIGRYPVSKIVPFSLLVPVVGMFSSVIIMGEPMQNWKIATAILVVTGLCINLFGQRIYKKFLLAQKLDPDPN